MAQAQPTDEQYQTAFFAIKSATNRGGEIKHGIEVLKSANKTGDLTRVILDICALMKHDGVHKLHGSVAWCLAVSDGIIKPDFDNDVDEMPLFDYKKWADPSTLSQHYPNGIPLDRVAQAMATGTSMYGLTYLAGFALNIATRLAVPVAGQSFRQSNPHRSEAADKKAKESPDISQEEFKTLVSSGNPKAVQMAGVNKKRLSAFDIAKTMLSSTGFSNFIKNEEIGLCNVLANNTNNTQSQALSQPEFKDFKDESFSHGAMLFTGLMINELFRQVHLAQLVHTLVVEVRNKHIRVRPGTNTLPRSFLRMTFDTMSKSKGWVIQLAHELGKQICIEYDTAVVELASMLQLDRFSRMKQNAQQSSIMRKKKGSSVPNLPRLESRRERASAELDDNGHLLDQAELDLDDFATALIKMLAQNRRLLKPGRDLQVLVESGMADTFETRWQRWETMAQKPQTAFEVLRELGEERTLTLNNIMTTYHLGLRRILGISALEAHAEADEMNDQVRMWQGWLATQPVARWFNIVINGARNVMLQNEQAVTALAAADTAAYRRVVRRLLGQIVEVGAWWYRFSYEADLLYRKKKMGIPSKEQVFSSKEHRPHEASQDGGQLEAMLAKGRRAVTAAVELDILRDRRLTWGAYGMLVLLLSLTAGVAIALSQAEGNLSDLGIIVVVAVYAAVLISVEWYRAHTHTRRVMHIMARAHRLQRDLGDELTCSAENYVDMAGEALIALMGTWGCLSYLNTCSYGGDIYKCSTLDEEERLRVLQRMRGGALGDSKASGIQVAQGDELCMLLLASPAAALIPQMEAMLSGKKRPQDEEKEA